MDKVFLIGDSVRRAYDKHVQDIFKGIAEVYYPEDNCRFALYVLRTMHSWKNELNLGDDVSLVHWNAGLWDTLRMFGEEPITPPEFYAYSIERVCKRLIKLFPNAKFVFATSTPCFENKFQPDMMRYNSDTVEYNRIACEIATKYGMHINDLYSVLDGVPESYYTDSTHPYTPEGEKLLTDAVANCIIKELGISKDIINAHPEIKAYSGEIIGI